MSKRKQSSPKYTAHDRSGRSVLSNLSIGIMAGAAMIAAIVLMAYAPCINGDFIWDDDKLVTDNNLIKAPDGLLRLWCTAESVDYWPMTNTSFWLEWRLWGMNPTGYHATNLILHILESILIWIILRKLSIPGISWQP